MLRRHVSPCQVGGVVALTADLFYFLEEDSLGGGRRTNLGLVIRVNFVNIYSVIFMCFM